MPNDQYHMILGTLDFLIASTFKECKPVMLLWSGVGLMNMIISIVFLLIGR